MNQNLTPDLSTIEQSQKEKVLNPISPGNITQDLSENIFLTTVDALHSWAR